MLLDDGIVLHHAERAVHTGSDQCAVVASHGHGDQPDGDGSGLCCWGVSGRDSGGLIRVAAIGPGIDWGRDRNREAALGFPTMGIVISRTFLGHLGRSWGSWSSWSLRNKFETAVDCFGVTCDESALFYGVTAADFDLGGQLTSHSQYYILSCSERLYWQ